VSHSGSTAGYKTWLARYPDEGVSVALMCNNGGINPVALGERIAGQALLASGHALASTEVSAPKAIAAIQAPADLSPYQGLFRNPVTDELLRLEAVGGQLVSGGKPLTYLGENRFRDASGDLIRFVPTVGNARELSLTRGASSQRFLTVRPASPDPAALADYVGTYYSAELDTRISVVRQGDALVMRQRFAVEWPLAPSFADGFTTRLRGVTTFVFARGPDGRVTSFGAWANGARDIAFIRQ
jgi:hypothetical protein